MGNLALDFFGQSEKGLGHGKLLLNVFYRDAMVHQGQKSSSLGGLEELLGDLIFAVLEVCTR